MEKVSLLFLFISLLSSCERQIDYRDSFIGTYSTTIYSYQSSNGPLIYEDSIQAELLVIKHQENQLAFLFPDSVRLAYFNVDTFGSKLGIIVDIDKYGKLTKGSLEETPYLYFLGKIRTDSFKIDHTFNPHNLFVLHRLRGSR